MSRKNASAASASRVGGPSWRTSLSAVTCIVAGALGWLLFSRGPNFAMKAETLQRQLLSQDVAPQERQRMLTMLMRHVDKLDSVAQRKLMADVRQQWREVQQEDMDAFFAAATGDRQKALDHSLDRLVLIVDLADAFSPGGMRVRQPRLPADRKASPSRPPAQDAATVAARRKAMEAYSDALEKRARERGIDFEAARRHLRRG
jgi:hypothetical protein